MNYEITYGKPQEGFQKKGWALYCGHLELGRRDLYSEVLTDLEILVEMGVDAKRLKIYRIDETWTEWPILAVEKKV